MNAADEVAVGAFLNKKIDFYRISEIVCETFEECLSFSSAKTLDGIIAADREARSVADRIVNSKLSLSKAQFI
jgi:1-deoxy-D-xylulose-5-phosphate reductoisomerase